MVFMAINSDSDSDSVATIMVLLCQEEGACCKTGVSPLLFGYRLPHWRQMSWNTQKWFK